MENRKITIISSDGVKFLVDEKNIVASYHNPNLSETLKNLIHDTKSNDVDIQLPNIEKDSLNSDVIKIIIQYCEKQSENPPDCVEADIDKIIEVMKQHINFHQSKLNHSSIANEINHCQFIISPIPQTYWDVLQKKIKPYIFEYINLNYSEEVKEDIWVHLRRLHENGFCCPDDDKIEYNAGRGKIDYEVTNWGREILEKYVGELFSTNFEDSFLTRIGLAADFLDIRNLQEDVAHLFSEYIEKILMKNIQIDNHNTTQIYDDVRKFFNVNDDINEKEKTDIFHLISCIDPHPL